MIANHVLCCVLQCCVPSRWRRVYTRGWRDSGFLERVKERKCFHHYSESKSWNDHYLLFKFYRISSNLYKALTIWMHHCYTITSFRSYLPLQRDPVMVPFRWIFTVFGMLRWAISFNKVNKHTSLKPRFKSERGIYWFANAIITITIVQLHLVLAVFFFHTCHYSL